MKIHTKFRLTSIPNMKIKFWHHKLSEFKNQNKRTLNQLIQSEIIRQHVPDVHSNKQNKTNSLSTTSWITFAVCLRDGLQKYSTTVKLVIRKTMVNLCLILHKWLKHNQFQTSTRINRTCKKINDIQKYVWNLMKC